MGPNAGPVGPSSTPFGESAVGTSRGSQFFQWVSPARSSPAPPDCEQCVNNSWPIVSIAARSDPSTTCV